MHAALKHYLNPLHLYCRLRDLGMPKQWALFLCKFYEKTMFRVLASGIALFSSENH